MTSSVGSGVTILWSAFLSQSLCLFSNSKQWSVTVCSLPCLAYFVIYLDAPGYVSPFNSRWTLEWIHVIDYYEAVWTFERKYLCRCVLSLLLGEEAGKKALGRRGNRCSFRRN